jgi:hypothetical protein
MKEHLVTHEIGRIADVSTGSETDPRRIARSFFISLVLSYQLLSRRRDHGSALRQSESAESFTESAYAD